MTPELDYWNTTGATKTFTHPVDFTWLRSLPPTARILDHGCGYGRVTGLLRHHGFTHVEGADPSSSLIARARREHPDLTFRDLPDPPHLPYADASIDAVLLLAVLTCIPADAGQRDLIAELSRVLRPGGLLYVSDLLLQTDHRNLRRYAESVHQPYGVFAVGDGAVCRHHSPEHLHSILDRFTVTDTRTITVPSMNGNPVDAMQLLATRDA